MTKKKSTTNTRNNQHSDYSSSSEAGAELLTLKSTLKNNRTSLSLVTDLYSSSEDEYAKETRKWDLNDKLNNANKFNVNYVKNFDAKEFNYSYIQKNGINAPIVFLDKTGLDMRTPSKIFTVNDIKTCVGSKRIVDVLDCTMQKSLTMSMKEWCEYYENPNRTRILNVTSLEFSHTKLEDYVEAPLVVRQLDWIETAWPRCLRLASNDSTSGEQLKYPKVQKYVLMSVAECYTDFHIDMGGTSVWYHVLKGEKVFFLIPPTEKNLEIFKKWVLDGKQSSEFLGDLVDECQRIVLQQGSTFLLPSGWIHAVYTSKDSIVFSGNFLHSFNIQMQLKIYELESQLNVSQSRRYPFYLQMLWFLIERYVHCFTGTTHLDSSCYSDSTNLSVQVNAYKTFEPNKNALTTHELDGLNALYEFMTRLISENSSEIFSAPPPDEIIDPELLFKKFKELLDSNKIVENELINGAPFIHWPKMDKKYLKQIVKKELNESSSSANSVRSDTRKHVMRNIPRTKGSIKKRLRPQNLPRSNVERRRRVRCHRCEPCTRDDCGECKYCKDMKKFGGTGVSKQCCLSKQCLQPLLPTTTTCMACDVIIDRKHENEANMMYECEICFEIYHVKCFREKYVHLSSVESIINEDLNNCWQCANCVNKGYVKQEQAYTKFIDSSLQQQLTLNTSMSDSLNNSFNTISSRTNDMFVSPLSTTTTELSMPLEQLQQQPPLKKKRHRRTKLEIEQSKKMLKKQEEEEQQQVIAVKNKVIAKKTYKKKNARRSNLTVDSLTNAEKEIILSEFCEIFYEDNESSESAEMKPMQVSNETLEHVPENEDDELYDENNSSIDNNYSMSTQNSSSLEVISDTELEEFENHEFNHDQESRSSTTNNNNSTSAEPLFKMVKAN